MIHCVWNLFYGNNATNKHNQNMKSLPFIESSNPILCLQTNDWKSSYITSSSLSVIIISTLSLFECITPSSSLSLKDTRLIAILLWVFHVSTFLRSLMIFSKYGLILIRYSPIDKVLFLPLLLSCSM